MSPPGPLLGCLVAIFLSKASCSCSKDEQHFSCSKDEQQQINSFAGGYAAGSFTRITVACTKAGYNVLSGLLVQDDFDTCLSQKVNISKTCAHCWWSPGQYGFDNCKMKCLGSWCSSTCLACAAPSVPNLIACAGIGGPAAVQCDGIPADQTGAENPVTFLAHKIWGGPARLYSNDAHAGKLAVSFPPALLLSLAFFACLVFCVVSLHMGRRLRSRSPQDSAADLTRAQIAIIADQDAAQYAELNQVQSSSETRQIC